MLKELKLLIGLKCYYEEITYTITDVYPNAKGDFFFSLSNEFIDLFPVERQDVELILRPFESITKAELQELFNLDSSPQRIVNLLPGWHGFIGKTYEYRYESSKRLRRDSINFSKLTLKQHLYLIEKGFDVWKS